MDVIHELIYLVIVPAVCVFLCLILPSFFIFNFIHTILQYLFPAKNMKGKVVLITGAASGIGEQVAYQYAKRGASLVIVDKNAHDLPKVAETARGLGSPDILQVCADVSIVEDCKRFVDEAIKHFGRLDHLVNNAGISSICPIEDITDVTNFTRVMDVNFWGYVYPTHFAIPHLKQSKGKILAISSAAALMHPPTLGFYSASKSAVKTFFETLRSELAPSITVTIATLGFIDSNMTRGKHLPGLTQTNPSTTTDVAESKKRERHVIFQSFVLMSSRASAGALVDGVVRGKRYVTEPKWYKAFFILEALCPQMVDWYYGHIFFRQVKHVLDEVSIPTSQTKAD
ncbi:11-beta-hydroxysteroid dehydrogenase-like 2 isoform X1 [Cornus florida]|uniref:11-beta-hydroxysteroid dehydrogenase-like 2 isoform X1 n=1 Tax=Cornus florida TaxID=4283 RepID=UPI00289B2A72|nr:11-beta-hydroxysteroid dehydrogenase-like 2 isoform X1 [Cornus florida]